MYADDTSIPLPAMYIDTADPAVTYTDGRVKAGRLWLDTSTGTIGTLKKRNAGNTGWDMLINFDAVVARTAVINDQTGTTYTLQASDNGKVLTFNNASGITVTVPSGLGAGFNCMCIQKGAGQVTFSPSSTTVNNRQSHTKIAGQYGTVSLIAYASNVFVLAGDTAA